MRYLCVSPCTLLENIRHFRAGKTKELLTSREGGEKEPSPLLPIKKEEGYTCVYPYIPLTKAFRIR